MFKDVIDDHSLKESLVTIHLPSQLAFSLNRKSHYIQWFTIDVESGGLNITWNKEIASDRYQVIPLLVVCEQARGWGNGFSTS